MLQVVKSGYRTSSRICILGGGFAGLYTALYLDRLSWSKGKKPEIVLIDQKDRFLFTPFLYELITGELQTWEVAPSFQKLLMDTDIQFHQGTVKGIDLQEHQILLQDGDPLLYDYLVLAVGRRSYSDTVSGISTNAYAFRTLEDAMRLQEKLHILENSIQSKIRVGIIGGGANAVELAGKLVDRLGERGEISLIVRGEKILKNFSTSCQKVAYKSLISRGVQVKFNTKVNALDEDSLTLMQGNQIYTTPIDLVIGTMGTQAREWLHFLECKHNSRGQLLTQPTLQLLDYPEVFALGDLADIRNRRDEQVPTTAQAAFQQGNCAAKNLKLAINKQPLRAFHYLHLGQMLTLGIHEATVSSFGIELKGFLAFIGRKCVYILLRMPTSSHRYEVVCYRIKRLTIKTFQQLVQGFYRFRKAISFFF
ncbi:pyridine nucleotide-disulfide oxidoreductase family protein [Lyngbya aestuarii BL J]|uniref:Pyridine nucleotide-disulfide oxidoreductase family protein n=2 Tax=Lyngbya aestuarii BL J TaxID=1348334 RepID=U7QCD3_9CYAN|nr:NAD(P)/FAD-dependent oxidoreductase [Lyngbya aestuarii]ERT05478.1 pyridine nucleotide-disulfide oxidoreductase family protein [Lyngbya aestuarii BL J]